MLKRKSLIICLLMILVASLSFAFVSQAKPVAQASTKESVAFAEDIIDFNVERPYAVSQNLTAVPKTFEALVKVNKTTKLSNGTYGVIMGNYASSAADYNDCFNICVTASGSPRFYWNNPGSNTTNSAGENIGFDWVVDSVKINTEEWTHIAFVRDTANDKTYFYLNGTLTATYNNAGDDMVPGSGKSGPIKIGMDSRGYSYIDQKMQGKLAYASLSATTKNVSQIADSMQKMLNGTITQNQNATMLNSVLFNADKSYYRPENDLTATPNTITATIKIPENYK